MPIVTLQTQARELGRIRLGASVLRNDGKKTPRKLETFRFTGPSEHAIRAVADLLGGEARPWEDAGRRLWEVLTPATEVPVMVPPGQAVSQWYELWRGGMCQRRCDGVTEILRQQPCVCPDDATERTAAAGRGAACKPTTRINVIIPDFPDVGVWRLESHGYYAAVELAGATQLLDGMRQAGQVVPAVLRAEPRETRVLRDGEPDVRKFVVPVLEIRQTLRELTALAGRPLAEALPPQPGALAIEAAPARRTDITSAQEAADATADAVDLPALNGLWKTVNANGWGDVPVAVAWTRDLVPVAAVFQRRAAELRPQPAAGGSQGGGR